MSVCTKGLFCKDRGIGGSGCYVRHRNSLLVTLFLLRSLLDTNYLEGPRFKLKFLINLVKEVYRYDCFVHLYVNLVGLVRIYLLLWVTIRLICCIKKTYYLCSFL